MCTGLFISPSGISAPCGTVAGMVTPKGSMSTEGETFQISVLPYVPIDMLLSASPVLVVAQSSSVFSEGLMNYPAYLCAYPWQEKYQSL